MSPPQDTDPAIRQHEELLARDPNDAVAHFNLALLYKRAGRHDDAVASYRRAIDLDIDDVQEVYSNLGVLYSEMRQPALAREAYEKSLSIEPGQEPIRRRLSEIGG